MKISTKGRYALRMLVDLAEHRDNGFIALKDICERQNVSKNYLEQIIPILNRANILITTRGSQGGYRLSKSPSQYTIGEIIRLTERNFSCVPFDIDASGSEIDDEGYMLSVWQGLNSVINEYLDGITIQDVLDRKYEYYANNYII